MKLYFEFREHEYYALAVVNISEHDFRMNKKPHNEAAKLYLELVGGESIDEILNEAHPIQVTQEYAFMKFVKSLCSGGQLVKEVVSEFDGATNSLLLIDGALV